MRHPRVELSRLSRPRVDIQILLTAAAVLGIVSGTGCSDRLTGPETVQLVDTLERALSPESQERRGHALEALMWGWGDKLARIPGISQVYLQRDGQRTPYHALVFERVMVPPAGIEDRSGCAGPRWFVLFWREGDKPEVVSLRGGQFRGPWVQGFHSCPDVYFMRPEPSLYSGDWWASDGDGDVSPGVVTGACAFLTPEDARVLLDARGITCDMTHHRVRFHVRLMRAGSRETSDLDLPPADAIGFRYTIHCDRSPHPDEQSCAGRVIPGKSDRTIASIRSVKDLEGNYYPREPIVFGEDLLQGITLGPGVWPTLLQASRNLQPEWFYCREQVFSLDTLHLSCEQDYPSKRTLRVDGSFLLKGLGQTTVNERDLDVLTAVVSVTNDGRPEYSKRHRFAFRPR